MPDKFPASPADRIKAIAERYSDTAFADTSKVIVVTQDEPGPALKEKSDLANESIKALNSREYGSEEKALFMMTKITEPRANRSFASPYVGALVLNASEFDKPTFFEKNESTLEAKFALLHELAHLNSKKIDEIKNGYYDDSFTNDYEYRLVSGWERTISPSMLNSLRNATGRPHAEPVDRAYFPSDEHHRHEIKSKALLNKINAVKSIETLHTLVSETYADAFAIFSYAVKEGATNGAKMAESVNEFRQKEAQFDKAEVSTNTHDSSRGMNWLASYLMSPAGARLVQVLNDKSTDQPSLALNVSKAASTFVEVNVRRWAEHRGMAPEQAKELSQWVHGQHQRAYDEMSRSTQSLAVEKPQVFSHDKTTIESLGKPKSGPEPMKAQDSKNSPSAGAERVMELSQRF